MSASRRSGWMSGAAGAAGGLAVAAGTVAALRRRRGAGREERPADVLTPRYRAGSGTPLLLLHGVGGTWRAWDPVLPLLVAHHDVLAPTLPGHGGAAPLGADVAPTVAAIVDALEVELDRAGWAQAHIVGNSLGGWLGIELARRGRARSLVLFSPAGAWRSQLAITGVALGIRAGVTVLSRCTAYADAIAGTAWLRRVLLSTQVAYPERVPAEALATNIRAGAHAPVVEPLLRALPHTHLASLPPDPARPVRVVWGDQDRLIPFDGFGAPMVERLPGAELVRQPGFGHVPMWDNPATVARLVLDVTSRVDGSAAAEDPVAESPVAEPIAERGGPTR